MKKKFVFKVLKVFPPLIAKGYINSIRIRMQKIITWEVQWTEWAISQIF